MAKATSRFKIVCLLCLTVVIGEGCASGGSRNVARNRGSRTAARGGGIDVQLSEGYGLLYALLSKQSSLDGILIIKSASDKTAELLREIAGVSGEAAEQLKAYADADPRLRIDWTGLREVENSVRANIEAATGKELLFAGEDFEVRVLLTQSEALRYGIHLLRVNNGFDQDEQRSAWAKQLQSKYSKLREQVVERLKVAAN